MTYKSQQNAAGPMQLLAQCRRNARERTGVGSQWDGGQPHVTRSPARACLLALQRVPSQSFICQLLISAAVPRLIDIAYFSCHRLLAAFYAYGFILPDADATLPSSYQVLLKPLITSLFDFQSQCALTQ